MKKISSILLFALLVCCFSCVLAPAAFCGSTTTDAAFILQAVTGIRENALGYTAADAAAILAGKPEGKPPAEPKTMQLVLEMGLSDAVNIDEPDISMMGYDIAEFSLDSNPSTGYSWRAVVGEAGIVEVSSEFARQESELPVPGRGGTEVFTIRALSAGTTTVSLYYGRHASAGFTDTDENGLDRDPLYVLTFTVRVYETYGKL